MEKQMHRRLFAIILAIFLLSFVFAYIYMDESFAEKRMGEFMENSRHLFDERGNMQVIPLFIDNVKATRSLTLYGILPFVFVPLILVGINGFLMGLALKTAYLRGASPLQVLLFGILPHGIVEFAAIFLAATIGSGLCLLVTRTILRKKTPPWKELLLYYLKIYVLYVLPLLVVAAILECHLTPRLHP